MHTAFVIGNIASGKSTATRYLESLGAWRIDLDAEAKRLYQPGSPVVGELVKAFGCEILSGEGGIIPRELAARAFSDPDHARTLQSIVYPALLQHLSNLLLPCACSPMTPSAPMLAVVEISVAKDFTDAFGLADDVLAITASLETRRARAQERGMSLADFDRRAALQPSEEELCKLANVVIDNELGDDSLFRELDAWLSSRDLCLSYGVMAGDGGSSAAPSCSSQNKLRNASPDDCDMHSSTEPVQ